jgi:Protein of unknown function (DUF3052)
LKSIAEKLQVKGTRRLTVLDAPGSLDIAIGGARTLLVEAEVALLFVRDKAELIETLAAHLPSVRRDAVLWIAYPKLTSKLKGDLNRDIIHDLAPAYGLDTIAAVAVDDDWSALRFKRI